MNRRSESIMESFESDPWSISQTVPAGEGRHQTFPENSSHTLSKSRFDAGLWKEVLFIGLLILLICWAFWGKDIERKIYGEQIQTGQIGAEILISYSGDIFNSGGISSPGGVSHLVVGTVLPNSPAERSGLKSGDLIMGLDGQIISSPAMATQILNSKKAGDTFRITVLRGNKSKEINLHLSTLELRDKALKIKSMPRGIHILAILIFLKLTILMFIFIYRNIEIRMHAVLFFALLVVLTGTFLGVYYPVDAFFSIRFNTISLLLGMCIISTVLDLAGFFGYVAFRIYKFAGHDKTKILVMFCLITCVCSLMVNNLTTILVMVPMTLNLSAKIGFDPRPVVIGEIIASNIGGASTMVGDFPNMLIASEAGIGFNQFILFMMPICLLFFGIMLIYLRARQDDFHDIEEYNNDNLQRLHQHKFTINEKTTIRRALITLCSMFILFIFSSFLSLNPSVIALTGGLLLFLFSGMNRNALLRHISFNDVLFFTGLFIMVGGLEASGLLQYVTQFIMLISMGKPWLCCIVLMWVAAFLTAFLSAGPTTALFFPIVAGIGAMPPHNIIWWSLSLGVLAGSSATMIGATAGPVATTLVENFSLKYRFDMRGTKRLTFHQFSGIGIPLAIIFLIIANIYIVLLNMAYA